MTLGNIGGAEESHKNMTPGKTEHLKKIGGARKFGKPDYPKARHIKKNRPQTRRHTYAHIPGHLNARVRNHINIQIRTVLPTPIKMIFQNKTKNSKGDIIQQRGQNIGIPNLEIDTPGTKHTGKAQFFSALGFVVLMSRERQRRVFG